nr:uncharacterized protein LOC112543513 [Pelodiscus sinensis]|eukprot:XP_025033572.1 uncharacterized protein LOC112543513 [Pelodiscus sinensis]
MAEANPRQQHHTTSLSLPQASGVLCLTLKPPDTSLVLMGSCPRCTKRHSPSWSGLEVEALLELWGQEEAQQDPRARRRNADIYNWMEQILDNSKHPLWTFEQIQCKVKELWLSYVYVSGPSEAGPHTCAYYTQLHCILGDEEDDASSPIVETGLWTPVVVQMEQEQEGEGQPARQAEEETSPTVPLPLELVAASQDVSQAASDAGDKSSAGPVWSEGPASPPLQAATGQGTHRCARIQAAACDGHQVHGADSGREGLHQPLMAPTCLGPVHGVVRSLW